jgi:hypothetical protein
MCVGLTVLSLLYQEGRSHSDKPLDWLTCPTHRHELQYDLAALCACDLPVTTILLRLVECPHYDKYYFVFHRVGILHSILGSDHCNMFSVLALISSIGFAASV